MVMFCGMGMFKDVARMFAHVVDWSRERRSVEWNLHQGSKTLNLDLRFQD